MSEDETPEFSASEFDPRKYLRLVFGYKWVILSVATLIAIAVTFWTLRQRKIYEADTTIQYDPNPPRPLGSEVEDVADGASSYWSSREFFETQNRILASRAIAERVVTRLGLAADPDFLRVPEKNQASFEPVAVEVAAGALQGRIRIEPVESTRLVQIIARDTSPERAQLIANAVADVYIEKTLEDRLGSTVTALEWLGQQLDSLRDELNRSELALHEFKQEHNVLSVSMEDRQNLVASDIQSFNEALTQTRTKRIELAARVARVRAANQNDPMTVDPSIFASDTTINSLRQQIREKTAEREALALRYGANWPSMNALVTEIETLKSQLRVEIESIINGAEGDLREVRQIEAGIRGALDTAQNAGLDLNLREIEYQRLNRERENKAKLYALVLQRTTETDLTRMLRTTHVRVVDRALRPTSPVSPRMVTNVAGGALAGLLFGLLAAFALSQLDRRLKGVDDVEGAGVTVLGIMPSISEGSPGVEDGNYKRRRKKKDAGEDLVPNVLDNRDLIVHTHPMSAAAECCRTIRTNLMFMGASEPLRTLVVTSSNPREGKTTVATSLAITLAHSGKSVLLIDTDLRRPRVHRAFDKTTVKRGTSSVLVGACELEDAVIPTPVDGLFICPCGPVPPNPSELLHGAGFRRLKDAAEAQYDMVVFDSPPLAVTDAAVLAPQLDGVLIVVEAQRTTRDALRSALRQLNDVSANIVGAVVNGIDLTRRGYGGEYYQYYRRDGYYYSEAGNDDEELAAE